MSTAKWKKAKYHSNKEYRIELIEKAKVRAKKRYNDPKIKPIIKRQTKAWTMANPKRAKTLFRSSHLKRTFGITSEDYDTLLKQQNNGCAICGITSPSIYNKRVRYFCVDHNHSTGQVRGLLCHYCNTGIGYFKDNIEYLFKAITYLLKYINERNS